MPINILMPALSPTMEKGNLAKWLKKEGDKVAPGDVLAEIETDKATMEVEAIDEGTLAKILVPEGAQDVPVNQPIAVLAGEGEDVKAAASGAGAKSAPPQDKAPQQARAPAQGGGETGAKPASGASTPPPSAQAAEGTRPGGSTPSTAAPGLAQAGPQASTSSPRAEAGAR